MFATLEKNPPKIDAKRTIPLMQYMIINQMMTNVTKKNQYSNKIGVKRNVLIVPRSCINSKLIRSHRQLHTVHTVTNSNATISSNTLIYICRPILFHFHIHDDPYTFKE